MPDEPRFRRSLRITRHRSDPGRDVRDEIDFYIEERTRELVEAGVPAEHAKRRAQEAFGDGSRIEAECNTIAVSIERGRRWRLLVETVSIDVHNALRELRRRPAFAALVIATLALCLGANAAVFSVVNGVVLRPLQLHAPERIVAVYNSYPELGVGRAGTSGPEFVERRENVDAFEEMAAYETQSRSVGEQASVRNAFSMTVTPSFFAVMGVEPLMGRTFLEREAEAGHDQVVVLSYGGWQRFFGGAPDAVGRLLRIGGDPHTVVGVMPRTFRFPTWDALLWLPLVLTPADLAASRRHDNSFNAIARLREGHGVDLAAEQIAALDEAAMAAMTDAESDAVRATGFRTVVRGFHDEIVHDVRPAVLILWAGAIAVMLIGAVNVANLHLVRAAGRRRELATRLVLGAGRGRILRQLLTESLILSLLGAVVGLGMAAWLLRGLDAFEVYQIPRLDEVAIGATTAVVALALALVVGTIVGLAPGLLLRQQNWQMSLRSAGTTRSASRAATSLRSVLVCAQVGLAVVLLAAAGLLVSSLLQLTRVDPGFAVDNLMVAALSPPQERYPTPRQVRQFVGELAVQARSIPGVEHAALASAVPFSGETNRRTVRVRDRAPSPGRAPVAHYSFQVGPGYFKTLGIGTLEGRVFSAGDGHDAAPVAVVDETFAATYWPGASALGHEFTNDVDTGPTTVYYRIVGVVPAIVHEDLARPNDVGAYYRPHAQAGGRFTRIALRTSVEPRSVLPGLRQKLSELDPEVPLFWTMTMRESIAESLIPRRLPTQLLSAFAVVAVFLAALGIYGVVAFAVGERSKEIGIRMAIGGRRVAILRLIVEQALRLVLLGQAIGLVVSVITSRGLTHLLHGVSPADPTVLGSVTVLMLIVAAVAALVPGRRATRVDPIRVLNSD